MTLFTFSLVQFLIFVIGLTMMGIFIVSVMLMPKVKGGVDLIALIAVAVIALGLSTIATDSLPNLEGDFIAAALTLLTAYSSYKAGRIAQVVYDRLN